jgi:hypothetical protein
MAQSGPSHEWVMLRGIGLWILYGPSHLNILWENGSSLIVRFDAVRTTAQSRPGRDPGVVELSIMVQIDNPRGVDGRYSALLSFPAEQAPGVQSLVEMLQSRASRDGETAPAAEIGFPAHPSAVTPDAQPSAPKPQMTQLAPVRIDASARPWTDDGDWIGLYPPRETERLVAQADRPAQAAEHPQAT